MQRKSTAIHESAHLVFFLRAGVKVRIAVSSSTGGRVLTDADDAGLHSDDYRLAILAGPLAEIEFWSRVNAALPTVQTLSAKWDHDLKFLEMTVSDVLHTDREFVREAWSKISAVADVLDAGYVIVPRMKWIEAAQ